MNDLSYIIIFGISLELIILVSFYAYKNRSIIDEMHGMMIGMTMGMLSGLVTATIYLIPTGNFLNGVIIGSLIGLAFGVFLGRLGGPLGIMEGIMAGPMGGMMGAMLGQMIRPFSIEVFMPFFLSILLITMIGISYVINQRVHATDHLEQSVINQANNKFVMAWTIPVIAILFLSFMLPFKITEATKQPPKKGVTAQIKNGVQKIDLTITATGYTPNKIIANKDMPLWINAKTKGESCSREIIFDGLGIHKIIAANGKGTIKINKPKPGTYTFHCPMDMVRGELIIN